MNKLTRSRREEFGSFTPLLWLKLRSHYLQLAGLTALLSGCFLISSVTVADESVIDAATVIRGPFEGVARADGAAFNTNYMNWIVGNGAHCHTNNQPAMSPVRPVNPESVSG